MNRSGFIRNPVLAREVRTQLRTRRAGIILFVYLAALCGLLFILWPRTGVYSLATAGSRTLFMVFLLGQLLLVVFFSPAFAATAITSEKERGTFDMVYASLMKPLSIAVGKLVSALCFPLLLIGASLPVTALCTLLGGVGIREMALTYLILCASAILFGLTGLCVSALCRKNTTAVVVTYILVIALCAGPWLPSLLLAGYPQLKLLVDVIQSFSPLTAMISVVQEGFLATIPGQSAPSITPWPTFLAFAAVASLLATVVFLLVLRRPPQTPLRARLAKFSDTSTAIKRKLSFPFYLIDPLRRKAMIGDWSNPIFVKEMRSRILGRPAFMLRAIALCLILSLVILILVGTQYSGTNPDTVRVVAIVFQLSIVILFAPAVAAGALTQEREGLTLDLLKMTGIPSRTVIFGKLSASFLYILIFLVTSVPVFIALCYLEVDDSYYWRIGAWSAILLATMAFCISAGLFFSSVLRSTATATAASYGLAALVAGGTLVVFLVQERIPGDAAFYALSLNPFAAAVQASCDSLLNRPFYTRELSVSLFGHGFSLRMLWHWNVAIQVLCILFFVAVSIIRFRRAYAPET